MAHWRPSPAEIGRDTIRRANAKHRQAMTRAEPTRETTMAYSATDGKTAEEIAAMKADKRAALAEARAMAPNEPERPNDWLRASIDAAQNKMPDLGERIFGKHRGGGQS